MTIAMTDYDYNFAQIQPFSQIQPILPQYNLFVQIEPILPQYSQLSPCGHSAITDTSLLRTKEKSPAETIKK